MNLKPRILLLTGLLIVVSAAGAWWVARQQAIRIVEQWAVRYAEKQVLYDKFRMFQPIFREIALARQLAASHELREWARKPDDPGLTRRAIAEMENFRLNFADRSYFVALRASGRYYHNNAKNEFADQQFRYVLSPEKPADRWFYDIIDQHRDMHINVNPDVALGVTKLWIDVLIRDGDEILGVAGTGLDLTTFIREVVDNAQPGIASLFVDHEGAIQVHHDERLIDFASITKHASERNTITLLFERIDDRNAILGAMRELESGRAGVLTRAVEMHGKSYLAGIAYLPEIGWHEITLLDLDVILPLTSFSAILLVYVLTLLAALVLFNLALGRLVLRPIANLESAIGKVRDGRFTPESLPSGGEGEIGRLMALFKSMATTVWQVRSDLEDKVKERTEALERLTETDPLTELLNRRGVSSRIEAQRSRSRRDNSLYGILLLDVDDFKEINDRHGHDAGDQALVRVADLIRSAIRPYDSAARWGGDEFLVLVEDCNEAMLKRVGERMRARCAEIHDLRDHEGKAIHLTLSIGGTLAGSEDSDGAIRKADQALYAAKNDGRNLMRLFAEPDAAQ